MSCCCPFLCSLSYLSSCQYLICNSKSPATSLQFHVEILYHTSVKYTSLWIAQFIKKWISAHLSHGVSLPTVRNESMMLSFLHGDTALPVFPMALKLLWSYQPLALETCFPLQRMVVFCSPLPGAQMAPVYTLAKRASACTSSPKKPEGRGVFGLHWSLPASFSPSSTLPPRNYLATRKISPRLNWDTINNSFSFNSLPVLIWTFLCPSQLSSISPAPNLCSSVLDG